MKRYAKLIQADKRGQIVIPKDVRQELSITEETGFYVYIIENGGILLKPVQPEPLEESPAMTELEEYAEKLGLTPQQLEKAAKQYKAENGGFEKL